VASGMYHLPLFQGVPSRVILQVWYMALTCHPYAKTVFT
jgi:hypothetical protein